MNSTLGPAGLAFLFLLIGAELGFLYWSLNDMAVPVGTVEACPANQTHRKCIIVRLADAATCAELVEVACRLASDREAELLLLHVLEIPLTMSLYSPLPAAEERARRLLEAGEAVARQHGQNVESRLMRHRAATEAILDLARESGAKAIVTGTSAPPWWSPAYIERTASALLRRAPCQIVVAKAPRVV